MSHSEPSRLIHASPNCDRWHLLCDPTNRACSEAGLAYVADRFSEGRVDELMQTVIG